MWQIARIDYKIGKTESSLLNSLGLFGLVWSYRKRDLPSFKELRKTNGFIAPKDDLALVRPDGKIRQVNEAD